MTNFEKYKDLFIDLLAGGQKIPCVETWRLRTKTKQLGCPQVFCSDDEDVCDVCKRLNKEWLEVEAPLLDLEKLKAGDKIKMRKIGERSTRVYEVEKVIRG